MYLCKEGEHQSTDVQKNQKSCSVFIDLFLIRNRTGMQFHAHTHVMNDIRVKDVH